MSRLMLIPLDRPEVAPRPISPRLRTELVYFAVFSDADQGESEFRFHPDEVAKWLDDGTISLISPLDTANMTEVELSEDQEALLTWLTKQGVWHVRIEER